MRAPLAEAVAMTATTTIASAPNFTSPRRYGRRPRRACFRRDEVAVPVEAVLWNTLERRIVDVDDAEPLRIAMRPLEVVEQAPDEVPLHGRAVGNGAGNGVDVRLDVRGPLGVVHLAVVAADVTERGSVLGDVDRTRRVVLRDPDQELVEPVRVDLPVHVRVLVLGVALHSRYVGAGADEEAEVV